MYKRQGLCLLNKHSKSSSKSATNAIKFTVTFRFITQCITPFIRGVLTTEKSRCSKIVPKLQEVVQDFDSLLGVSADREVIDKQQLYPGIILDPFTILIEIFLAVQNDQFIQQITVIHELTAIIPATSFHTAC